MTGATEFLPFPEESEKALGMKTRLLDLCLILLTLAGYWGVWRFGFVNYDDPIYVRHNALVAEGLTSKAVSDSVLEFHASNWHPLVWISFMAEIEFFGLEPGVMHATNLVIHITNSILLFAFLKSASGSRNRSFLSALIFAVHPLHVESVAWITERKDVLSTFFMFLSMLVYVNYARKPRWFTYLFVLLTLALGLSAKAMLVTVPALLLLLDYWPLCRFSLDFRARANRIRLRNAILEKLPFLVLSGAVAWLTILAQRETAMASTERLPLTERMANSAVAYMRYVWKTLVPTDLCICYPLPIAGWPMLTVLASAAMLFGITALVFQQRNSRPYLVTGWLWFVVSLLPVIGLFQVGIMSIADRYTYVSMPGLTIAALWCIPDGFFRIRRVFLPVVAVSALLLISRTRHQVSFWSDSIVLFERALEVEPKDNSQPHMNLCVAYCEIGKLDVAADHAAKAFKIRPEPVDEILRLASELSAGDRLNAACAFVKGALLNSPEDSRLWQEMGMLTRRLGNSQVARVCFIRAIEFDSQNSMAHNNLGLLVARDDPAAAMGCFQAAVASDPANAEAYNNLGDAYFREGMKEPAKVAYLRAIELADLPEAHKNLKILEAGGDLLNESSR